MSSNLEYLTPSAEEAQSVGLMLGQALHFGNPTATEIDSWLERIGHEDFRYTRVDGQIASGLRIIWMAQWFGGVKVPAAGVTVVGAAPPFRGKGSTGWLLQRMHEEVRERGYPLAVLFPATVTFYRRVGYELSGAWNSYEIDLSHITLKNRELPVAPVPPGDYSQIKPLYDRRAAVTNGMLDRPELMWTRTHEPKDKIAFRYLFGPPEAPEGYVSYIQGGQFEPIKITDHCTLSREATLRLLTVFSDHRSLATKLEWHGGPNDPLLFLLPEHKVKSTELIEWMIRITDVEKALAMRGYPPGLTTRVELDIQDDQLSWNHGRFTLDIADGRAEVSRGGSGALQMDVRTLAPLYTGFLTPQELRIAGRLEGDDRSAAAAQLAFSGPCPWMEDIF